jgi:hypothetical protein
LSCIPAPNFVWVVMPARGFRDQQTLASTQGWYAAQRAGFHIAAITETVVTAGVLAFAAVA